MKVQQSASAGEGVDPGAPGSTSTMLAQVSRELAEWVPVLRRLIECGTMRGLVQGHSFEITSATVRSIIAARDLRDDYFWPGMNESAWSVLLELFASRMEGSRIDVAGLCDATGLTPDIALHWADWLAGRGIVSMKHIEGEASPLDLTDSGADSMRAYLLASLSLSPWVN